MVDLQTVKTDVQQEVGFIKANWGKLSFVIVISLVIGAFIGHLI